MRDSKEELYLVELCSGFLLASAAALKNTSFTFALFVF